MRHPSRRDAAVAIAALAWESLPAHHRVLLENIGVHRHEVVEAPLGAFVNDLMISAGEEGLTPTERKSLDRASGIWVQPLRLVLLNAGHPALVGLDEASYETMVAHTAWHEWGHALSLTRASEEDISAGRKLLHLATPGVTEAIREGGYRSRELTHELIAECYAHLMRHRTRGHDGKPEWLADELYELVRRVTEWRG